MLARADKSHKKLNLETVNLSELAAMVAEQQQESADARGIALQTEIEPGLVLQGDETMLMRMLINLMENGIKYGRENGWLRVTLKQQGAFICGSVQDNGPALRRNTWTRYGSGSGRQTLPAAKVGRGSAFPW